MAKLNKFTSVTLLEKFSIPNLIEFLGRFPAYLKARKVKLTEESFAFDKIIPLFARVEEDTPKELLEAAFFIEQMATRSGRAKVVKEAKARKILLGYDTEEITVHDFILMTWLRYPDLLEAAKSRVVMKRQRTFCTCPPTRGEVHPFVRSEMGAVAALEKGLADVLPGCDPGSVKVLEYDDERCDEVWFLVRRTDFLERVAVMSASGAPEAIFVRPLRYDVIVYDKVHGELRINADKSLHGEYRQEFGQFLFGRQDFFAKRDVYSLDVLFDDDPAFLDCSSIAGIDSIRWTGICCEFPGAYGIRRRDGSPDMVRSQRLKNEPFVPPGVVIHHAKFDVLFEGATSVRSVLVMAGDSANYSRESDSSALDYWLRQSGIMITLLQQVAHAA